MRIDEITVGPVETRCYILSREDGDRCIVIDPGAEAARVRKAAGGKTIEAILLTHGPERRRDAAAPQHYGTGGHGPGAGRGLLHPGGAGGEGAAHAGAYPGQRLLPD